MFMSFSLLSTLTSTFVSLSISLPIMYPHLLLCIFKSLSLSCIYTSLSTFQLGSVLLCLCCAESSIKASYFILIESMIFSLKTGERENSSFCPKIISNVIRSRARTNSLFRLYSIFVYLCNVDRLILKVGITSL